MKKKLYILLIVPVLFLITGCGKVAETDFAANDGIVIQYTENTYEFDGQRKIVDNFYVIEVYSDRTIKYGYKKDVLKEKKLSVSKYNKLITLALSEDFYNEFFADVDIENVDPEEIDLTKNIGTKGDKTKGTDSYVYIFSENGGVIGVGGEDATNTMYNKLIKLLKKYGK